ncbi:ATP-binding protein [Mycobacterium sp. 050134]|uniref:ATP-binding protein n=1 Tax=Mycobacterium sp. 050134 TaxID=3096111 RepID=UPI002EDB4438
MSDTDDRPRFVRTRVSADAHNAAQARAGFAHWLGGHFSLGAERFNDVLLAVNEAIANAAEFAYVGAARPGTLDVNATYDAGSDALVVAVNDHGRWRTKVPQPAGGRQEFRGRGIPLMEALADELTIDRTPHGTRVTLTWTGLKRHGREG